MRSVSYREFKPAIYFLAKFLGIYLIGNVLYGIFVDSYNPKPDPITHVVTVQTAALLTAFGWPISVEDDRIRPTTRLYYEGKNILAVYEGCNGINVMIIFVAFVVAFGPAKTAGLWFVPVGCLVLHVMNLARILLLFFVSLQMPQMMYFVHKYLFTAILYAITFALWIVWIKKIARRST